MCVVRISSVVLLLTFVVLCIGCSPASEVIALSVEGMD